MFSLCCIAQRLKATKVEDTIRKEIEREKDHKNGMREGKKHESTKIKARQHESYFKVEFRSRCFFQIKPKTPPDCSELHTLCPPAAGISGGRVRNCK